MKMDLAPDICIQCAWRIAASLVETCTRNGFRTGAQAMVSDIHRTIVQIQEGNISNKPPVSDSHILFVIE